MFIVIYPKINQRLKQKIKSNKFPIDHNKIKINKMLQSFKPNKAKPISYVDIFRYHITTTLKKPQDWQKVEPTFRRMEDLRSGFVWDDIAKSEMFNNPHMRVVQDNIEEYLRYCIFLSTKFKFGSKEGVQGFTSDWLMSWTGDKVKHNGMLFEICNMLYNYVILNFNQAVIYLTRGGKHTKAEYKGSLEKLRYAKWGAKELITLNAELSKTMKVPLELRPDSLEFLLGLTEGLSYLCFYYMFEDESNPAVKGDNLASLEKEIAKWFFVCRNSLTSNKDLRKIMKHLYPDILEYYYLYTFNSIVRAIRLTGEQHEAQKTKGFIGIQYAYMLEAEALVKQMKNDDKFPGKDDIKRRYEKEINPLQSAVYEKIKQVYKCPIPKPQELDFIKPIQTKVTEIEPKNIRIPPPDAPYFSAFYSEKLEGLRSSIQLFISNKKQHIQKSYYDVQEKMREVYSNNNVEALAHCMDLKEMVLNDEFKTQMKVFKEMNGGGATLHNINQNLQNYSAMIEAVMANCDQLILEQQKLDQELRGITGNDNSITSFEDGNKAELNQLTRKFFLIYVIYTRKIFYLFFI